MREERTAPTIVLPFSKASLSIYLSSHFDSQDFVGFRLSTALVQRMIAHAEIKNLPSEPSSKGIEDEVRRQFVRRFEDELLVVARDVLYFAPRKANLRN